MNRKIDETGRISIPKEMRKQLEIEDQESLNIEVKDNKIILSKKNEVDYKERIDKAIKMIEKMTEKELNDITYKGEKYLVCSSDFGEGADIILDILKGEDNE